MNTSHSQGESVSGTIILRCDYETPIQTPYKFPLLRNNRLEQLRSK